MRRPIINRTTDNHAKVEVHKVVNRISNNIRAGEKDYEIGSFTVVLVDEVEYGNARQELNIGHGRAYEIPLDKYPSGGFKNDEEAAAFYSKASASFEDGPAFWVMPTASMNLSFGPQLEGGESYIFICPPRVKERTISITDRMFDHPGAALFDANLRLSLLHELGHHFLYGFLPARELTKIRKQGEDLTMSEGLANWFAYNLSSELERHILAESMVERSIAYRSYLEMRFMDPSDVLRNLREGGSYLDALNAFIKMMGGKIIGGFNLDCHKDIISQGTVFMDSSRLMDTMWNIMCRGKVTHLGPIWGNVVVPEIETLVGRLPKMTLVVTSKIHSHPDYAKLPKNVVFRAETDILAALTSATMRPGMSPQQRMVGLLTQLKVEDKWIQQLLNYERQLAQSSEAKGTGQ